MSNLRGVSSLYAELALLTVIAGVGAAIIGVATSMASSAARVEPPPRVAAYLVRNKTVIVSWDDRVLKVALVCPGTGVVRSVEVVRGAHVLDCSCEGLALVVSGYVIKAVRVLQ